MSEKKILLSADTPCDIGDELKARYSVSLFPLHIILDGKLYGWLGYHLGRTLSGLVEP
jgi:fatty acid-binding protein DegV